MWKNRLISYPLNLFLEIVNIEQQKKSFGVVPSYFPQLCIVHTDLQYQGQK